MTTPRIVAAMDYLDEDLITEAIADKPSQKNHTRWKSIAAIAACMVMVMGSLLTVEAASGGVSNFFAPLFGVTQTDLIDNIGLPIHASASADGYTLTANAVIGDRYNMAVVYTLTRDDGQPITEDLYFTSWKTDVCSDSSGGGSLIPVMNQDDPRQLYFIESWSRSKSMLDRYVTVSFSNLAINREGPDDLVIATGPWEFNYTLRYKDSTVKVPAKHANVTDKAGNHYQINKILLSPIGLHLEGLYLDPTSHEAATPNSFQVAVKKTDGTAIPLDDFNISCSFSEKKKSSPIDFQAMFEAPIPLSEIDALIICDTEFPTKQDDNS